MNDELVTAAVFGDHTQAVVARMHVEEAGIPAFLLDELMSDGLFVVGSATGGIKLQVPASRLEDAIRVINERLPEHAASVDWSEVDVGEPEPMEEFDDDHLASAPPTKPVSPPESPVEPTEPTDLTLRERRANRIVSGAMIGIFAWPVYVFAFWRLIQIACSDEQLRPEYQRKANIGATIVLIQTFAMFCPCCLGIYELALLWR